MRPLVPNPHGKGTHVEESTGGRGGFATSIQTYMHNVCLEFGPSTGSIMTCVCALRMSTMFVFNLAHIACDKFVKHVLNLLSRPGCFRQRRKVLAHHSRCVRACICQFLFARPLSVARHPPFASHDQMHCDASPCSRVMSPCLICAQKHTNIGNMYI